MACSGRFADAEDYQGIWADEYSAGHEPLILKLLDMAATQIHMAMAATGACDCTLASWAEDALKHLNCVIAALFVKGSGCPFPMLTQEEQEFYGRWVEERLREIRDGDVPLCQGDTGNKYPAVGWAEMSVTDFAARDIIWNYNWRNDVD